MTRSTTAKDQARADIIARYLRGETQAAIALDYGVSQQQISADIRIMRQRWRDEQTSSMDEHIAQKLEEIRLVKLAAWQGWERSLTPRETVTESSSEIEGVTTEKRSVRREGQCGNPAFLRQVMDCIKQEAILLGLPVELKYQDINSAIATTIAAGYEVVDPGDV